MWHALCIQEIKDIKESYQIPAIFVVKMRYFFKILYERGNIMKEKKNMYGFPYFISNQRLKDTFRRSKERKEINEIYVLISLFYQDSKV